MTIREGQTVSARQIGLAARDYFVLYFRACLGAPATLFLRARPCSSASRALPESYQQFSGVHSSEGLY